MKPKVSIYISNKLLKTKKYLQSRIYCVDHTIIISNAIIGSTILPIIQILWIIVS